MHRAFVVPGLVVHYGIPKSIELLGPVSSHPVSSETGVSYPSGIHMWQWKVGHWSLISDFPIRTFINDMYREFSGAMFDYQRVDVKKDQFNRPKKMIYVHEFMAYVQL